MIKNYEDFRANDNRADPSAPESRKAINEANHSFRLARLHHMEARRKLAEAKLIFESPERIEQEFRENEEDIERPTDPDVTEVLRELGGGEGYSLTDPGTKEIYLSSIREQERIGLLYPSTVEILFPPQVRAEYASDGVILDVREVLHWLAQDMEKDRPDGAAMFRQIADRYYPDADDEEEDDEDEDREEAA